MQFRIGDKVKVMFPQGDVVGTDVIRKYQNKVTIIKEIKTYHKGTSSLGRSYVLAGCRSDWGIDYEFIEEWLVPIVEGVEI